jgi:molybdenum cofactor biosynthesis enzyme MoaA
MDYYCPTKFTDMQVNIQSRQLQNCCKAWPEHADLDWLEANPGKMFHTDTMIADRTLMLEDKSCVSCHHGCYKYEERGLSSERLQQSNKDFISDTNAPLKRLFISLSTDCNLTCMYCSSQFSTSWYKEIEKNGKYVLEGQSLENDNWTKLWSKIKQKQRSIESRFFDIVLREIKLAEGIEEIKILGGEPLLNNQLFEVIDAVDCDNIVIITGLGISADRLAKFLEKIDNKKNISFNVSAEATGKFFELTRYGITWNDFTQRVNMIKDKGYGIDFISTVSNISVLDFHNFVELYHDHKININPITDRQFLMPHVLDDRSKKDLIDDIKSRNNVSQFQEISRLVNPDPGETDRKNFGNYLKQFSSRRSIDLSFLPEHLRKWCGL